MKDKIRILVIVSSLGIGGNENFALNLMRFINREIFQIDFFVVNPSRMNYYNEVIRRGCKVFIGRKNTGDDKYRKWISDILFIDKILKKGKYDIIHCNSCSFIGIFRGVIPGFFNRNTRVIAHSHNAGDINGKKFDILVRNILKKVLCKMIDYGFACSDVAARSKYTIKFLNSKRYAFIYNAIDFDKYSFDYDKRIAIRNQLGINSSTIVIGTVGRLEEQKNHKFLLDIFTSLQVLRKNSKLMIIGDGSLMEELQQRVSELDITDNVLLLGQKENASEYYHAMDVFALTSIYEGLPYVLIEAQINGLPCVISDIVTRDVVISDRIRYVSLDKSLNEWADEILNCFDNGYDRVNQDPRMNKFDLIKEIKSIEDIYISLSKSCR